ncbi:MAG: hypothetical protein RJQ09_07555 [Cyclobacteriaceae bacterium]
MDIFNPAVTSGVDIFVYIVIGLISFVSALLAVDVRRTKEGSKEK